MAQYDSGQKPGGSKTAGKKRKAAVVLPGFLHAHLQSR
jgi:hypothetical protein